MASRAKHKCISYHKPFNSRLKRVSRIYPLEIPVQPRVELSSFFQPLALFQMVKLTASDLAEAIKNEKNL